MASFVVTCSGRTCSFDASASSDDRGIVAYQWTLGNNSAASGRTFTYTYAFSGTYSIRLTVTDALGQQGFTPPPRYWWGQTTFNYTVSDGHGRSDTATITINFTY